MSGLTARVAITGTPGTGKTSVCASASWESLSVVELARNNGCLEPIDSTDGAAPIDVEKLASILSNSWDTVDNPVLIDGHLSHHLPVDALVLLRCHPKTLHQRLERREYSANKIEQNVESELIGSIAGECFEKVNIPCLEIDTTAIDSNEILRRLMDWVADGFKPFRPEEPVDWIATIHGGD